MTYPVLGDGAIVSAACLQRESPTRSYLSNLIRPFAAAERTLIDVHSDLPNLPYPELLDTE